jgi:hypothetical protein
MCFLSFFVFINTAGNNICYQTVISSSNTIEGSGIFGIIAKIIKKTPLTQERYK